jgi:hypothetical protein
LRENRQIRPFSPRAFANGLQTGDDRRPMPDPYREPATQEQALAEALFLALMAPDERKAAAATLLAEQLAVGLDAATVAQAKAHALERWEAETG